MSTIESTMRAAAPAADLSSSLERTATELKRGAFVNAITLVVSNFRGIFIFLVARLLGPAILGTFSVAWATTDLLSKIGIFGLDDAITTFVARADAVGNRARARTLFHLAVGLGLLQSVLSAIVLIAGVRLLGSALGLQPEMVSALAVVLCAMPGIALYRISNGVSRGLRVMRHDTYSRGLTESIITTLAFVVALAAGINDFAPAIAAIAGVSASGVVATVLAARLFANTPHDRGSFSFLHDTRQLLGFAFPISAYQFLNAFILRLDFIMLGWFVGRAPGVTLATVGIYGAVIGIASGLRKVNHAFNPIFAPVVAGMTATGDHERAAATYARLTGWMLWILLPIVAVLALAGKPILLIFGPAFGQGSVWLGVTAVACAIDAFVGFGETVIMVQKPRLNLLNSSISCIISCGANLWLIPRYGVMGAAVGLLIPYTVQGILRSVVLRLVFRWRNPWRNAVPPFAAAFVAAVPALLCRIVLPGLGGELIAAAAFLAVFGAAWNLHRRHSSE